LPDDLRIYVDLHLIDGLLRRLQMLDALGEAQPMFLLQITHIGYRDGVLTAGPCWPVDEATPARPGLHGAEPSELVQVQRQACFNGSLPVGAKVVGP
jgi:hypothetical protein